MQRNIKITIEYDGTLFHGWQIQGKKVRTVQEEIRKAAVKIFGAPVTVIGSGRTDTGVHALGQVANFQVSTRLSPEQIRNALNAHLPPDIAVLKAEDVPLKFHAQFDAKSKIYRYTILNRPFRCAQLKNFCLLYPYNLNVRLMQKESKVLIGKNNFKSFAASDPHSIKSGNKEKTTRTIKKITIKKTQNIFTIDIEADGFLYKMVRNMVGTLLAVGSGLLPPGSTKKILDKKNRNQAPKTAPALGLCLMNVKY